MLTRVDDHGFQIANLGLDSTDVADGTDYTKYMKNVDMEE